MTETYEIDLFSLRFLNPLKSYEFHRPMPILSDLHPLKLILFFFSFLFFFLCFFSFIGKDSCDTLSRHRLR